MADTFYLEVDWDKDDSYTQEDAARVKSFLLRRGRRQSVSGEGYERVNTGELSVTMGNEDQRYNPFNTSSPIYAYLKPNRPVRLRYQDPGGTYYDLFTGFVKNIIPQKGPKVARVEAVDGIEFLAKRGGDDIAVQTDYAVSSALNDILTAADYPFAGGGGWVFPISFASPPSFDSTAIEDNGDTIPYFWGQSSKSAWDQLIEVAHAFAGDVFIARDGQFAYRTRNPDSTSVLTLTDDDILDATQIEQPWSEIRNYVKVITEPLTATAALSEIWRNYDTPLIEPGESITIWADYQYDGKFGPATSVTTPVSTTDYTANTAADGSGSNRTANLGVTFTAYAVRAKIVLTNNGADNLYVTMFKIRGTMLYAPQQVAFIEEDATSQTDFEKRVMTVTSPFLQSADTGRNHAQFARGMYSDPRKVVWVQVLNRISIQVVPDLFDVVSLDLTELGISADFRLTYIEHDFRPRNFKTTWRLEPMSGASWTFPMTFGVNNVFGW